MKKKSKVYCRAVFQLLGLCVFALSSQIAVVAQEVEEALPIEAAVEQETVNTVTINVKDANISEVLKAYSLQTGQSIVVGPDVVSENVNVRLNDIPWQEALDVILKPYGFGYRVVGETIVISRLENIVTVEGIEPLTSKVFTLKYLDAYDVKDVIAAQLTQRGKITILSNKGLPGWEFGGGASSSGSGAASNLGSSKRKEVEPIEKSKTIIVTDVPSSITAISAMLEELDELPAQVLIESRFVEVGTAALTDIGFDFATGIDGLTTAGVQPANSGDNQWGVEQNDSLVEPSAFNPLAEGLSGSNPYNAGLQLLFSRIGGSDFSMLLHALEEDGDAEILSAPRVLTLDNQEAAILVGTKYPIIESDSSGGNVSGGNVSTSLDYYENIGIQLNVIPQVCDDEFINMIVHPVVSEIDGFVSGVVSTGVGEQGALTQYPILKVRETQTQILLKSEDSVVIGGLQSEKDQESIFKVPLLGDIPYLGRLFRRETVNTTKIDLMIFIKATIIDREDYAAASAKDSDEWEIRAGRKTAEEETLEAETASDGEMIETEVAAEIAEVEAMEAVEAVDTNSVPAVEWVEEDAVAEEVAEEAAAEQAVEEMAEEAAAEEMTEAVAEEMAEEAVAEEVVEEIVAEEVVEAAAETVSEEEEIVAFVNEELSADQEAGSAEM